RVFRPSSYVGSSIAVSPAEESPQKETGAGPNGPAPVLSPRWFLFLRCLEAAAPEGARALRESVRLTRSERLIREVVHDGRSGRSELALVDRQQRPGGSRGTREALPSVRIAAEARRELEGRRAGRGEDLRQCFEANGCLGHGGSPHDRRRAGRRCRSWRT